MSKKINCWEFVRCGRYPGGPKEKELGVCPAAISNPQLSGVNGGHNGGRVCWAIAGTLCRGKVQGTFAEKAKDCKHCMFFQIVQDEEGQNFKLTVPGL